MYNSKSALIGQNRAFSVAKEFFSVFKHFLDDILSHNEIDILKTNPKNSETPPPPAEDAPADDVGGGLSEADIESNWDETIEAFDGMELPEELLRGIYAYGFEKPSAIQQRAIKPTILGKDLIAQAQSGTVSVYNLDVEAGGMIILK